MPDAPAPSRSTLVPVLGCIALLLFGLNFYRFLDLRVYPNRAVFFSNDVRLHHRHSLRRHCGERKHRIRIRRYDREAAGMDALRQHMDEERRRLDRERQRLEERLRSQQIELDTRRRHLERTGTPSEAATPAVSPTSRRGAHVLGRRVHGIHVHGTQ